MAFELNRLHKLDHHLEDMAYQWTESAVKEHFLTEVKYLTESDIDELAAVVDHYDQIRSDPMRSLSIAEDLACYSLNSMMDYWMMENESEYCYDKGYR